MRSKKMMRAKTTVKIIRERNKSDKQKEKI